MLKTKRIHSKIFKKKTGWKNLSHHHLRTYKIVEHIKQHPVWPNARNKKKSALPRKV